MAATMTDKPVKYYETSSETKALNPVENGADSGGIIFVKASGAKSGKIYKDGIPYGGGGEDESFADDAEAAGVTIGGLTSGTELKGMSTKAVLEQMVYPEFAPYFVDASAGISCSMGGTAVASGAIMEVGASTPADGDYSLSGSTAKAVGNAANTAENGTASTSKAVNADTVTGGSVHYGSVTTQPGSFKIRCTSVCAIGTTTVKTNKGNMTNKTGGSASSRSLLASASVNSSNLVTSYTDSTNSVIKDVVVKGTTKTADHVIYYVYRLYASTGSAGIPTAQTLTTGKTDVQFTLKAGACIIAVPAVYTVSAIKEVTGLGTLDNKDAWTSSTDDSSYKNAAGNAVSYKVWRRNEPANSDLTVKVTFS